MVRLGERRSARIPSRRSSENNISTNERRQQDDNNVRNSSRRSLDLDINTNEVEDEDNDDVIQDSIASRENNYGGKKLLYIILAVIVVLVGFIIYFLFIAPNTSTQNVPDEVNNYQQNQQSNQQPQNNDNIVGVGTQDFTQNTTMTNSSILSNPDDFVKDIYGLTVRVDYTVNNIQYIADFVSYTKHRGTWGGGLELYYLECTYKDSKYVVQVPFQYYKELDDSGIVPVKMEVLRIVDSSSSSGYLTIISYMCLDEETLRTILKSQNK